MPPDEMPPDEMPPEFWQGVEQFNQRQFYACHDTLEAIWIEAAQTDKKFYQGILQIAVALYHLGNQNWRGAVILMGEGIHRLGAYQPIYGGIDVAAFLLETVALQQHLQELGPEKVSVAIQQLGYQNLADQPVDASLQINAADANEKSAIEKSNLQFPRLQIVEPF